MAESLPKVEPDAFVAGDRVRWTRSITLFGEHRDPADSWVLKYAFVSPENQFEVTGTDNGDGSHLIDITAAVSADYAPGVYNWQAYVTKTTDRFFVRAGTLCIEPNFDVLTSHDARSWAVRLLAAIEAIMEGKASRDQLSYSIAGRTLTRLSWDDLRMQRDKLRAEVNAEEQRERIVKGLGHRNRVLVRL